MANIYSTITYNANLSAAQAQLKALTGQVAGLTAAFNTLDKSAIKAQASLASTFMSNVGQIGGFTSQIVKSGTAVDNFGRALSKQRLTMRQYFREALAGYTKQNSMMKQLAAQQVRMQQSALVPMGVGPGGVGSTAVLTPTSLSAAGSAAAMASQKFSIFNELIRGGSERLLNFGKNTQWTGRQLMVGFTLPLILFTGLVSKQFRDIDKELTRFEKVYGADLVETVDSSTKKMRERVKELAFEISSAYGIAARETAALAADIAQTGKEGEDLISSVRQTTRLQVLGEVERQEAMRATLSIQNAFKLNTNELAEAIDFLNAVENQTSTNLQDLAGAIPRVGPVIQALGGDIKDMSLLLVAMREGGVSAAEAANALKSGLGRLINPTKQARDVAASFGVSLEDIIQGSRGELLPMIFGLQDALQGLDDFARAQVIEKVFGKYQFARMAALFANLRRQGSQTLSVMELAGASTTELAGIANKELRALQESSSMRFQRTVENLKNSLVPLGEIFTEGLIPILSAIGSGIKGFVEFFQSLPEPVKNFSKYILIVTALAGPIVMLVGLFGNLVANGIKFSMMIVRMGAKIAGLRFEKFELLTADVIAAKTGVDNLNTSFMTQEAALKRLVSVMGTYSTALATLMRTNPALFAGSALGTAPAPVRTLPVLRRQKGSTGPETVPGGYGGGDKIPALLEPGEFVVRKEAARKYGPILLSMNKGTLQGLAKGTQEEGRPYDISSRSPIRQRSHVTPYVDIPAQTAKKYAAPYSRGLIDQEVMSGRTNIRLFSNLVLDLTKGTNILLKGTGVQAQYLASQISNAKAWQSIMTMTGLSMKDIKPVADLLSTTFRNMGTELVDDPLLYKTVGNALKDVTISGTKAAQTMALLAGQYGTLAYGSSQQRTKMGSISSGVRSYTDVGQMRPGSRLYTQDVMAPGLKTSVAAGIKRGLRDSTREGSPSREADAIGYRSGFNLGTGAVNGLRRGMMQATSRAPVTPVGPGLESTSVRSKIAVKEGSILKFTELQEQAARRRTIAEGQIANIQLEMSKTMRRTDISLDQRLVITDKLRNDLAEQRAIIQSATLIEKRASDNVANAKNALAALIARTPPPTFLGMPGIGPSGGRGSGGGPPIFLGMPSMPPRPSSTGPSASLSNAQRSAMESQTGMRGMGAMNAMFAITMLTSSLSMLGGQSNDLVMKLGILTSAVMTAAITMQMFSGKNVMGNFLGLGSLGGKVSGAGVAAQRGVIQQYGSARAAKAAGAGGAGQNLLKMGGAISMLGGPVGMGIAAALAGGVAGYMMYQKAAEEARERAVAAFADPAKTAEFFGIQITDVTEKLKAASAQVEGVEEIDKNLKEAVKQDYGRLIEKIRYGSAEAGARELALTFNKMIASGLSEEQATEAVKAISVEAGYVGGQAYAEGLRQGMFEAKTAEEMAAAMADMFDPSKTKSAMDATQKTLDMMEKRVGVGGRIAGTLAQNFDNTLGDILSSVMSFSNNINVPLQIVRALLPTGPIDYLFDKDMMQGAVDSAANVERQIHQMQTNIEEMADISSESLVKITESMFQNFKDAPVETMEAMDKIIKIAKESTAVAFDPQPIKDFINEIDPIGGAILSAMIGTDEDLALIVMKALSAGMSVADISEALMKGGPVKLEAEIDVTTSRAELEDQIKDIMEGIRNAGVELVDEEISVTEKLIQDSQKGLDKLDAQYERYEKKQRRIRNQRVRDIEKIIEGLEEEKESISDLAEEERKRFEEKVDKLNEEKDRINESTDAYINSIQKRQRADNFYASQRKSSLSALQKLASGDVFGFLQERQQMSQDAQQFSYDTEIENIEEARDREIKAIDETIKSEEEKQKLFEENTEKRIDLINDEIDAQNKAADQAEELYERRLRGFERRQKEERKSFEKTIKTQTTKLADLKVIKDQLDSDQVTSAEEVTKRLGEEFGKRYMDEMSIIIKLRYQRALDDEIRKQTEQGLPVDMAAAERAAAQLVAPYYYGLMGGRDVSGRPRGGPDPIQVILDWLAGIDTRDYYNPNSGNTNQNGSGAPGSSGPAGGNLNYDNPQNEDSSSTPVPDVGDVDSPYPRHSGKPNPRSSDPNATWIQHYEGPLVIGPDGKRYSWSSEQGRYLYFAQGGFVSGPGTSTSDSIPARLSDGEYVVKASSVSRYGRGMMDAINEQRFAEGGYVSKSTDPEGDSGRKSIGKASPKFVSGRILPKKEEAPPPSETSTYNYAGGGEPILDASLLASEGVSLETAKNAVKFIQQAGWPSQLIRLAYTIAMRESNGIPTLFKRYSATNSDTGLFQINEGAYSSQPWFDIERLKEGVYNAQMAYQYVSQMGKNFLPWAMTPGFDGTNGWDWSYYKNSSVFAEGSPAREATLRRTALFWNSFKGFTTGNTGTYPGSGSGSSAANLAVSYIRSKIGAPYVSTPPGPNPPASWDCSKLTAWAWAVGTGADPSRGYNDPNAKVRLTALSHEQGNQITKRVISKGYGQPISGLVPGDILYFAQNGPGVYPGHTSMYVGNDQVVQASSPSTGVILSPLNSPWNIGPGKFMWGGPPKGYKAGGFVSGMGGPRSDMIPAMLSNGEYVMKAGAVSKYGRGMLDQINSGNFNLSSASQPEFNVPIMPSTPSGMNNYGGDKSNVKIIINGASGKSATAIANKVASMINSSNNRRNHSRSI